MTLLGDNVTEQDFVYEDRHLLELKKDLPSKKIIQELVNMLPKRRDRNA